MPSPLHACMRKKGSSQKGRTSLSSRYIYCGPIWLQNHGHMTLVERNYAWSVRTRVRSVYAHGTEVVVSFYFTHTRIAHYCIPAGRASATLLTRLFLPFCVGGAGHETTFYYGNKVFIVYLKSLFCTGALVARMAKLRRPAA